MRKIYLYHNGGDCPVADFIELADQKIRRKFAFCMDYIKEERNGFCEPYVKHFSIEKYRQLYECRIKATGRMVRVIFYEHNSEILLLHAFYKRDRKDTEKALEAARKLLDMAVDENGEILAAHRRGVVKIA